jgi:polyisoprenoid-binding protein YceI
MKRIATAVLIIASCALQAHTKTVWKIDKAHSNLDFTVRYMALSNVRGTYTDFDAVLIQNGEDFTGSRVEVTVKAASIYTRNNDRDNHLRSSDFFDAENNPDITFVSGEFVKKDENMYTIPGELTIRGVTRPVEIEAEIMGTAVDPRGNTRVAFTGTTIINRNEFGVQWNRVLEAGGFLVGEDVTILITTQFVKQS